MTLLHAFINQLITLIITILIGYPQLRDTTSNWGRATYVSAALFFVGFGTWIRWHFQIPLLGPFASLWTGV